MTSHQITPEEIKRRESEKRKRYAKCMKLLKPMGFVQCASSAYLHGMPSVALDMDDPDVYNAEKPEAVIMIVIYRNAAIVREATKRTIREALGVFL